MITSSSTYQLPHKLLNGSKLRILGNEKTLRKINIDCRHRILPRLPSNKNLVIGPEYWTKSTNQQLNFSKRSILLDFVNCSQHILWEVVSENNLQFINHSRPPGNYSLVNFQYLQGTLIVTLDIQSNRDATNSCIWHFSKSKNLGTKWQSQISSSI